MKQVFSSAGTPTTTATVYTSPFSAKEFDGTQTNGTGIWSVAGTLRNLVVVGVAPGAGDTVTWTLLKNGIATALTLTITETSTRGQDITHEVTIAAGDTYSLRRTHTGSPAEGKATISIEFEADAANVSCYAGLDKTCSAGQVTYSAPLTSDDFDTVNASTTHTCIIPVAGTFTRLDMRLTATPGGAATRTFVLMKNGVVQDGAGGTANTTVTIANPNTTGTASFSLSVVAGDTLVLRATPAGAPTACLVSNSLAFTSAVPGAFIFAVGTHGSGQAALGATRYNGTPGINGWTVTEDDHKMVAGVTSVTLSGMRVTADASPGGGGRTVTLRKNNAATALTLTLAGAASGSNLVDSVSLADTDFWSIQTVDVSGSAHALVWTFMGTTLVQTTQAGLWRTDTGNTENGEEYTARLTSKPRLLHNPLNQFGISSAVIEGKRAEAQLEVRIIADFGLRTKTEFVALTDSNTQLERVIRPLGDVRMSEMTAVQLEIEDGAEGNERWAIDAVVMKQKKEQTS